MSPLTQDQQVKILAVALVATVVVATAVIVWQAAQLTIKSRGRIRTFGVGVFEDPECQVAVGSIDWGVMDPGMGKAVNLYVKNTGSDPGVLTMNTSNWQPAQADQYLKLTWNLENQTLVAAAVAPGTFVLQVSDDVTGVTDFEFDINVYLIAQPLD